MIFWILVGVFRKNYYVCWKVIRVDYERSERVNMVVVCGLELGGGRRGWGGRRDVGRDGVGEGMWGEDGGGRDCGV